MSTRRPPPSAPQSQTMQPRKNKHRPRLNPSELSSKISTFFSPTLFPRLPPAPPSPPSLAYSRLPPPCAELDPEPTYRIRRFKLWRKQVVDLRKIVLDQRLRGHLVRYQTYALPNTSNWSRGVQRKIFPRGPQIKDYSAWPDLSSIKNRRSGRTALPYPPPGKPPPSIPPAQLSAPVQPLKLSGPERRKRRERLKQHRWVLHAENERRWRQCMREIMADVTYFQEGCMLEASQWKDGVGVWLPDFNVDEVIQRTNTFRDIRRHPDKVFDLCTGVPRVKGRAEADSAIKANEAERKARKAERRRNRAAGKEAKAVQCGIHSPTPQSGFAQAKSGPPQASKTEKDRGDKSADQSSRRNSRNPAYTKVDCRATVIGAGDNFCRPHPGTIPVKRTAPKKMSSSPQLDSGKASQPIETEKRSTSSHQRPSKPRTARQIAQAEPSGVRKRMSKEDTSSLFSLLRHMADLQAKRDDVMGQGQALKKAIAQTARSGSGSAALGKTPERNDGKHVFSRIASNVDQPSKSGHGRAAKSHRANEGRRTRSDEPVIASTSSFPSVASSATANQTHHSLRPGSLFVDDDTVHTQTTPSETTVSLGAKDETDVDDLDVGALQVLIRKILAEGR